MHFLWEFIVLSHTRHAVFLMFFIQRCVYSGLHGLPSNPSDDEDGQFGLD